MDWQEMYDILKELIGVSEEALEIGFAVGGCNTETAERILFYKTGWRTFEGWFNSLHEDNDE